ncbi:hypothetical protein SAMN05421539_10688 [Jannaschia seohaensis]|uniref:Uncharacterized protein n=1 Tax=Jannaschia seohaensis TaxID=475081 RepID=A0A2Y9C196_9RHOB|nr:hypothetical protein BCF38_10688 [Jannaschia seohaensis]SSA47562.1 hypothetical protein SAMN05421539_10688 [Jannaschia seohaensis]
MDALRPILAPQPRNSGASVNTRNTDLTPTGPFTARPEIDT